MKRENLPLAGAALLVAAALGRLPSARQIVRPVATPFDRSRDLGAAPSLVLFRRAGALIPRGSSVAVGAVSGAPKDTAYCRLAAASLLPWRDVRPAPVAPLAHLEADFLILEGENPPIEGPGRLLLWTPQGAIWKLDR